MAKVKFADLPADEQEALQLQARKQVMDEIAPSGNGDDEDEARIARLKSELNLEAFKDIAGLDDVNAVLSKAINEVLEAEMATLDAQVASKLAVMLASRTRTVHVTEFCARVTGGNPENPYGLRVSTGKLANFLLSLDTEKRLEAEAIFESFWKEGRVEMSEIGHEGIKHGTRILETEIASQLKAHVDNGGSLEDFFEINEPVLGAMEQYDLAAYAVKED